jgi:hypothetical protein
VLICSALMVNLRRIWRTEQQLAKGGSEQPLSLLSRCWVRLRRRVQGWYACSFPNLDLAPAKA